VKKGVIRYVLPGRRGGANDLHPVEREGGLKRREKERVGGAEEKKENFAALGRTKKPGGCESRTGRGKKEGM